MDQINLRFNAGVEYKGKIYASAIYINGLLQLDLTTQKLTYLKCFAEEKPCYAIHRCAFLHGDEAWFVPQNGKYIAIVNLETLDITYIAPPYKSVNEKAVERINSVYFSGGIIADKFLYLIPTNIDTLLLIDLDSKKLYPYYDITDSDEYFLFGTYLDGCIYLIPYTGNHFVKIDLRTNKRNRYLWKYSFEDYANLAGIGNQLWICPGRSDRLISIDLNTNETEEIAIREYNDDCAYDQVILIGNELFIVPFNGDKILKFEIENRRIIEIKLDEELLVNGKNGLTEIFSEDNLILASYANNFVLIHDKEKDDFRKIKISIGLDDLIKEIEKNADLSMVKTLDVVYEYIYMPDKFWFEQFWGVNNYIQLDWKETENLNKKNSINFGNAIWRRTKDEGITR